MMGCPPRRWILTLLIGLFAIAPPSPGSLLEPAAPGEEASPAQRALDRAKAERNAWTTLAPELVRPHPDAERFPGPVPGDAPRLAGVEVIVDAGAPRWHAKKHFWHATGLYAPPGEVVRIEGSNIPERWRVRIGAHSDTSNIKGANKQGVFRRTPADLTNSAEFQGGAAAIANPFGGPVYIETPEGPAGRVTLRVSGAVRAPSFRLGSTSLEQWRESRLAGAPWAELASDHVALTVPSELVRDLDDPTELMEFWERSARLAADLGADDSPQRLVWDPAISAGSMHSGHPIMCQGGRDQIASLERLRRGEVWGFFHEIGHNNQFGAWTPKGQGEVTCNWFPMHVREVGLGLPAFDRTWPRFDASKPLERGAIGTRINGNHFLGLIIWDQIREEFGWEPFRQFLRSVRDPARAAPSRGNQPGHDVEPRWDELLVRFSLATGRDLSPHFAAWGAEISDPAPPELRAALRRLTPWVHPLAPGQPGAAEHYAPPTTPK